MLSHLLGRCSGPDASQALPKAGSKVFMPSARPRDLPVEGVVRDAVGSESVSSEKSLISRLLQAIFTNSPCSRCACGGSKLGIQPFWTINSLNLEQGVSFRHQRRCERDAGKISENAIASFYVLERSPPAARFVPVPNSNIERCCRLDHRADRSETAPPRFLALQAKRHSPGAVHAQPR